MATSYVGTRGMGRLRRFRARFFERLKSVSAEQSRCEISVSLGLARFDPCSHASIEELMMKADKAMYEQKRHRSKSRFETAANS